MVGSPQTGLLIKKVFYTLQGEGPNTGRPCIFIRTVGCNSWDGRDSTKQQSPCSFCDTDFVKDDASFKCVTFADLINALDFLNTGFAFKDLGVVLTGGEPLLQFDLDVINGLAELFKWVDIETNGSIYIDVKKLLPNVTVICSPKFGEVKITPHVWKVLCPDKLNYLEHINRDVPVYIQPVEQGFRSVSNLKQAVQLVLKDASLRLCLQVHKYAGLE